MAARSRRVSDLRIEINNVLCYRRYGHLLGLDCLERQATLVYARKEVQDRRDFGFPPVGIAEVGGPELDQLPPRRNTIWKKLHVTATAGTESETPRRTA